VRNRERKQSERYRRREITYTGGSHVPLKESKSTGKIKRHKERRKEKKEDQDKQKKSEKQETSDRQSDIPLMTMSEETFLRRAPSLLRFSAHI
jgi:hypothetical protein